MGTGRTGRAMTFARAARCYWLEAFPVARGELRRWRGHAEAIPEPELRRAALLALQSKSGNAEGLAAFAVLAPRPGRRAVVRAAIAYQTALDYLDTITERTAHPYGEKLKLNGALEVAVDGELSLEGYREETGGRGDREYLTALLDRCRRSLGGLPSYAAARSALRQRARLGAESQAMNHSLLLDAEERELEGWAQGVAARSGLAGELRWWEVVAAAASTPALGALIALAARPGAGAGDFAAVDGAYFPWVNALNTLLDSLVDLDEDHARQRHIERYGSTQAAAERLAAIVAAARAGVRELPGAQRHELILAAMGGYYLAEDAAWRGERAAIAAATLDGLGPFARPALAVHRLRQGRPGRAAQRTSQVRTIVTATLGPPANE